LVFCPECGKRSNDKVKFCSYCGYDFRNLEENIETQYLDEESPEEPVRNRYSHENTRADKTKREGLDNLIIIGYILAILGVFVSGILSIGGLIVGIMIYRRGTPYINVYGANAQTHALIIILISIVTMVIGIIVLFLILSIFTTVFGFMGGGFSSPY
jgi:hypothetical protein